MEDLGVGRKERRLPAEPGMVGLLVGLFIGLFVELLCALFVGPFGAEVVIDSAGVVCNDTTNSTHQQLVSVQKMDMQYNEHSFQKTHAGQESSTMQAP